MTATRLALAAALATQLGACTVQKGGSGPDGGDAVVAVTWSVRTTAGVEVPCPAGTTTAQVIAQHVDAVAGTPEGAPETTLFDCAAKGGTIELVPDAYILSVRLQSMDGSAIYATSLPSPLLDLSAVDASQTFEIFTDGGYLSVGWDLTDTAGALEDCERADVQDVRVVLTPTGGGGGSGAPVRTDAMPCVSGYGTSTLTSAIPAGEYAAEVIAEAQGVTVGSASVPDVIVQAPNVVGGLGEVTIPIASHATAR